MLKSQFPQANATRLTRPNSQPTITSGGSILRMISGAEGKATPDFTGDDLASAGNKTVSGEQPEPSLTAPSDPPLLGSPPGSAPSYGSQHPDLDALNPALSAQQPLEPWSPANYLPTGAWPWGPRTPMEQRSSGRGEPLVGSSWLNRPLYAGWFAGEIFGDTLLDGDVAARNAFYGGFRTGWDYDPYWGVETRLGFGRLGLSNLERTVPYKLGTVDVTAWDVDVMYYPWGDARWRPFFTAGLGLINFEFVAQGGRAYDETLLEIPIGIGVKRQCNEWVAVRMELIDQVGIGAAGLNTVHNLTLTAGVDLSFGGRRQSYWPWNPDMYLR